jgi:hypothetical protein
MIPRLALFLQEDNINMRAHEKSPAVRAVKPLRKCCAISGH